VTVSTDDRSIGTLLSEAMTQLSALFRTEMRLARAEVTTQVSRAAMGIGLIGGAALFGVAALVILLLALADWLTLLGLVRPIADLIAFAVGIVVAAALAWTGYGRLTAGSLAPRRTVEQVQRDVTAIKEHVA
jgi:hypothetical protein